MIVEPTQPLTVRYESYQVEITIATSVIKGIGMGLDQPKQVVCEQVWGALKRQFPTRRFFVRFPDLTFVTA